MADGLQDTSSNKIETKIVGTMSRMSHPPAVGPSEPEISVINVISDQQNQNPSFREKSDNYAGEQVFQ